MRKDRVLYATVAMLMVAGALVPAASPLGLQNGLLNTEPALPMVDPAVLAEKIREANGGKAINPLTGQTLGPMSGSGLDYELPETPGIQPGDLQTPHPMMAFLRVFATAEDPSLALGQAMMSYNAASGRAPGPDLVDMPENQTISFTYPVGDINDDGVQDVVMNTFCNSAEDCYPGSGAGADVSRIPENVNRNVVSSKRAPGEGYDCRHPWSFQTFGVNPYFFGRLPPGIEGLQPGNPFFAGPPNAGQGPFYTMPNRLIAVSGYNGTELWNYTLSELSYDLLHGVSDGNPNPDSPPDPTKLGPSLIDWAQKLAEEVQRWPTEYPDNDDRRLNYAKHILSNYVLDGLCPVEFVIGTIPDAQGGENPLVYRYTIYPRPQCACPLNLNPPANPGYPPYAWMGLGDLIFHEVYAIDHKTGTRLWTYHDMGNYVTTGSPASFHVRANKLFLNPIIMKVPRDGVDLLDNKTQDALFLQDVSFDADIIIGPAEPGASNPDVYMDSFQPKERLARLDFMGDGNGRAKMLFDAAAVTPDGNNADTAILSKRGWKPTIQPDYMVCAGAATEPITGACYGDEGANSRPDFEQSTMPWIMNLQNYNAFALMTMSPIHWSAAPVQRSYGDQSYWHYKPCCFDVDGDSIPDVVYQMYKWNVQPRFNNEGPYMVKLTMRAYSGATGDPIQWADGDAVLDAGDNKENPTKRCIRDEFICVFAPPAVRPWTELIGDADGDGKDDILVHIEYRYEDYRHHVNVISGATGKRLWEKDLIRARNVFTLPLGDSDGDGGNDFAVFEWEDWEYPDRTVYHYTNITVMPITVYNGANGAKIWTSVTKTFNAPIDLLFMYMNFKLNGLPDVDGDGVGDLVMDDPLYLPDLEVVHRLKYVKGTTGQKLYEFNCVGTFSFITYIGDINNDTIDDFGLLNGDIVDLWMTMYNGKNGTAEWSRRLWNPKISDYTFAIPRIRTHALTDPLDNQTGSSFLVNFQLEVISFAGFFPLNTINAEIYWYRADGNLTWGVPHPESIFVNSLVEGVTTGTLSYQNAYALATKPVGATATAKEVAVAAAPWAGLFGLAFLSSLPVAKFQPWRLKKGG